MRFLQQLNYFHLIFTAASAVASAGGAGMSTAAGGAALWFRSTGNMPVEEQVAAFCYVHTALAEITIGPHLKAYHFQL